MKKAMSFLLALIFIFTLCQKSSAAQTGKYIVVKDVTAVFSSPGITSEKISELSKGTVIEISEIRNNVFGKAFIPKDAISGWVQMGALQKYEENKDEALLSEIKIKKLPDKLTYIDGMESLSLAGLQVVSVDITGKESVITKYSVFAPEMKVPGEKTVKILYKGLSAEFNVTVERVPVQSISLVTLPKDEYKENATLDLSGLSVFLQFKNPEMNNTFTFDEIKDNPDFEIKTCHGETDGCTLAKGEHEFKIIYKYSDISCSFKINVTPRKLVSLTVKQNPNAMTVFSNTEIPSLEGMILEAHYDNGETKDVYHYSLEAVCDPSQFVIGPGNEVKVYYGGLFVTLSFRYSKAQEQGISVVTPTKLTFVKGEKIDLSTVEVYLVYTDGTRNKVTDFVMSEVDLSVTGTQNITVQYKNYSEVFSVYISPYFGLGDVDGDGKITASDARQALRGSVGLVKLSGNTFFAADVDSDEKVTASDARLILRASVGLEKFY